MATVKHETRFEFNRSAEVLFPLFSAEGEKSWVPGWDYENIMGATDLHEDYVFLTAGHSSSEDHTSGHHEAAKVIWLVKRYEPANYYVQFYLVEPGDMVGIVTVHCKPLEAALTEVNVSYEFIGLSNKGNDFINGYTSELFESCIGQWPIWLQGYFDTIAA